MLAPAPRSMPVPCIASRHVHGSLIDEDFDVHGAMLIAEDDCVRGSLSS